jgi:hypothetical protein
MATLVATPPNEVIWNLCNSVVSCRSLYLVAELGIADHLGDTPRSAAQLAEPAGVNADALERILRLLTTYGIFERTDEGYRHTDASRLLCSDHPQSMRSFAWLNGLPGLWASLGAMDHALRTGAAAWEAVDPRGFFPYLQSHPHEAAVFEQAMTAKARFDISTILGGYDFRPFRTIVDVAGGYGHLLKAVLAAAPDSHGILFELPDVASTVELDAQRMKVQAGDFFTDSLPRADLYLLMEIIHDWSDAEALRILRSVRAGAEAGATVLVIEDIAPDQGVEWRSQSMDVLMLAVTGGRQRTTTQHAALLADAGFRITRVVETAGPMNIVEGVAV